MQLASDLFNSWQTGQPGGQFGKKDNQYGCNYHTAQEKGHSFEILLKGTSRATPLIIKTLIPTGGVMTPISVTRIIITPNQIGVKTHLNYQGKEDRYGQHY
jgi:hypothetical protein